MHAASQSSSKKKVQSRVLIFGVCMPKPTKTPKGTADGKVKKQKKEKKEKKDKKVKKDANADDDKCPVYRLTDPTTQAPRGARALATIVSKLMPDVSFNQLKLLFKPSSGMTGMSGITGNASQAAGPTLICANASSGSTSDIRVWSYVRGVNHDASTPSTQSCKLQWGRVDPRLPWTFVDSVEWALVTELWGGRRWLRHADAKAQRDHLRGLGFLCTTSSTMLDPLPEALASGKLLKGMAVRACRKDFPKADKAGLPKHAKSLLTHGLGFRGGV